MLNSILPHSVLPILERFIFIILKHPLEPEILFFFQEKQVNKIFSKTFYISARFLPFTHWLAA